MQPDNLVFGDPLAGVHDHERLLTQRLPLASPQRGNGGATTGVNGLAPIRRRAPRPMAMPRPRITRMQRTPKAEGRQERQKANGTDSKGGKRDASGLSEGERTD